LHLFGDRSGPHLTHFKAHRQKDTVELGWDVRNAPELRWRVLRSERGFAETADVHVGGDQMVVMEGTDTFAFDDAIEDGVAYFYTVFVLGENGAWHKQVSAKVAHNDRHEWRRPEAGDGPLRDGSSLPEGLMIDSHTVNRQGMG
jgi:hypothetical protein